MRLGLPIALTSIGGAIFVFSSLPLSGLVLDLWSNLGTAPGWWIEGISRAIQLASIIMVIGGLTALAGALLLIFTFLASNKTKDLEKTIKALEKKAQECQDLYDNTGQFRYLQKRDRYNRRIRRHQDTLTRVKGVQFTERINN